MNWRELSWLVPWVIAAFFWGRGLWRGSIADCAGGMFVTLIWFGWWWLACGVGGLNALGGFLMLLAGLTFGMSFLVPPRPKFTSREMMTAAAGMLIAGFFLILLL